MKFIPLPQKGAYLIDLDKKGDERGFFARLFCQEEFRNQGLDPNVIQANCSLSQDKGTLRGLHYQLPPFEESKLIRCVSGALYDVVLDIRKDSPTFGKAFGAKLTPENRTMMYVPKGFAHGFLTLEAYTEVLYFVSAPYSKEHERGIRWNDPTFKIYWPEKPMVISERDRSHPDFQLEPSLLPLELR